MGYLIFKGISTGSLGNVYVAEMPSHRKAQMRVQEFYVDGRDGALHREEGLSNFDLDVTLIMLNEQPQVRQAINAWATGTGKLIVSDDPTQCYRASVIQEVRFTRANYGGLMCDTARVVFNCQPYMYEAVEEVKTFTASGTLKNPGTATSLPLIQVNGSGTCVFSVAGQQITLTGVVSGTPVYIDCETGYVYTGAGASTMQGEFPELQTGDNTITLTSGVSSLVITPRWRWI